MLDLIKIDIKKFGLKKLPLYFLIANIPLALIAFAILYMTNSALIESAPEVIDILVKPVFIIWEAILISRIIIDEFKNKTMLMLYTYPINKKKLIISKVLIATGYSLSGIWGSQIILNILFYVLSRFMPQIPYLLSLNQVIAYLVSSLMVILLGLIPLSAGLVQYSTVATMVTSLMIVIMGSSSGLGFDQLLNRLSVVSIMGVIGIISAVYSISRTLKRDLLV